MLSRCEIGRSSCLHKKIGGGGRHVRKHGRRRLSEKKGGALGGACNPARANMVGHEREGTR